MSESVLKTLTGPVVLVGAGKMGGAMLDGWLRLGLPADKAVVLDPHLPADAGAALAARGVSVNPAHAAIPTPAVLLLAVKPAETRMGGGKGTPEHWVAVIKPGRILFELEGVTIETAREAMDTALFDTVGEA